jgi:hypothetical protein
MSKTRFVYTIQKSPLQYYIGAATLNSMPLEFYGLSSSTDFLPDTVKAFKYPIQIVSFHNDSKSLKASLKSVIEEYTNKGCDLKTSIQEHKDKISQSLKNKWNDTGYVKKQESLRSDPTYRDKLSNARKSMYENSGQDICIAMSNLVNSRWSDDSKRINQSLKLKQRWQDPEFRNKVLESRKKI